MFRNINLFGHGKITSGGGGFSFWVGKVFLIFAWGVFIGCLLLMYTFTFHRSSDFEKEALKLKYEKRELLDEVLLNQKDLSDMQSREFVEESERIKNMVDASEIDYYSE